MPTEVNYIYFFLLLFNTRLADLQNEVYDEKFIYILYAKLIVFQKHNDFS